MGILYRTKDPKLYVEIPTANAKIMENTKQNTTTGLVNNMISLLLRIILISTKIVNANKIKLSKAEKNITIFLTSHK